MLNFLTIVRKWGGGEGASQSPTLAIFNRQLLRSFLNPIGGEHTFVSHQAKHLNKRFARLAVPEWAQQGRLPT